VSVKALKELASDDEVVRISPDRPVKALLDYAAPTVGADLAWQSGWDGSGIGVAVIDSGINPALDLGGTRRQVA